MTGLCQSSLPVGEDIPSRYSLVCMAFVPCPSAASRNIRSTTRLSGSWITRASRLVIPKAVRWLHCRDDLALTSLLEFPSPAPLSELCPLVLRELVQHAIRQLALRGIVATVI